MTNYEAAVRHAGETVPRGRRIHMRRIVRELTRLKGGPVQLTEAASVAFFRSGEAVKRRARGCADCGEISREVRYWASTLSLSGRFVSLFALRRG